MIFVESLDWLEEGHEGLRREHLYRLWSEHVRGTVSLANRLGGQLDRGQRPEGDQSNPPLFMDQPNPPQHRGSNQPADTSVMGRGLLGR